MKHIPILLLTITSTSLLMGCGGSNAPTSVDHTNQCLVTFVNVDGTTIKEEWVPKGGSATAPNDVEFPYYGLIRKQDGWVGNYTDVNHDTVVYPYYFEYPENITYIINGDYLGSSFYSNNNEATLYGVRHNDLFKDFIYENKTYTPVAIEYEGVRSTYNAYLTGPLSNTFRTVYSPGSNFDVPINHPYFTVKNNLLLSKDGKIAFGYNKQDEIEETVIFPDTVKVIAPCFTLLSIYQYQFNEGLEYIFASGERYYNDEEKEPPFTLSIPKTVKLISPCFYQSLFRYVLWDVDEENAYYSSSTDGELLSKDGTTFVLMSYNTLKKEEQEIGYQYNTYIKEGIKELGPYCLCGTSPDNIILPISLETISRFSLYSNTPLRAYSILIFPEENSIKSVDDLAFAAPYPYKGYSYSYLGQLLSVEPELADTLLTKANELFPFDNAFTSDPYYTKFKFALSLDYKLRKLDEYGFIKHHRFTDYLVEKEMDEETVTSIKEFLSNEDITLEQVKTNEIVKGFMDEYKGYTIVFCPKKVDSRGRTISQYYLAVYRKIFNIDFTTSSRKYTVYSETIE